jgi:hypothetical protein
MKILTLVNAIITVASAMQGPDAFTLYAAVTTAVQIIYVWRWH